MALVSAEKYDELAPSHCLPRGSGQGIVAASASTGKEVADVRFGVIRYRRIQSQCPLCQKRKNLARQRNDARGHVWTAPAVQGKNRTIQRNVRVQPCIRPLNAAALAGGPDVIR